MPMSAAYRNAIRDHGQSIITHIGLVNNSGVEISGGGYARLPVTWVDDTDGVSRPSGNLAFTVGTGAEVGGWRGFSALSAGTNYGGADYPVGAERKTFSNPGTYTLLAASTSINHTAT